LVKNAEFSMNLSPEAYEQLIQRIDTGSDPSYAIEDAEQKVFHFAGNRMPTLNVDSSLDGTILKIGDFSSNGHSSLTSGSGPEVANSKFYPSGDDKVRVVDLGGGVKAIVYPEVATSGNVEHGLSRRVRLFVGGDTREALKDPAKTQETIEAVFAKIGVDASPPTETQIRDQLAKDFLAKATAMKAGIIDPSFHSGYGTDYDSPDTMKAALANLASYDVKPEDITYSLAGGKVNIALTPEAAKRVSVELGKQRSAEMGVSATHTGGTPKVPTFYSSQNMKISDIEEREKFIRRLYNDGSHTGSLDRAEKSQSHGSWLAKKGMSGGEDSAHKAGEGMYIRVADNAGEVNKDTGVILFTDDVVGKLDGQWSRNDVYGNPHSLTPNKWDTAGGPWQLFVNGKQTASSSNEVYIPHQVPWNEAIVNLKKVIPDQLAALEKDVRAQKVDLGVLNSRNVVIQSGSGYRFIVWEAGSNGPVMKLGPVVKWADLPSAKITGKLGKYKTPTDDAASELGFTRTG
jgi:hypothetical protein